MNTASLRCLRLEPGNTRQTTAGAYNLNTKRYILNTPSTTSNLTVFDFKAKLLSPN